MKNQSGHSVKSGILYGIRVSKITPPLLPDCISVKESHKFLLHQAEKEGPYTVLVSAPAGYGKSTLIAAWLSEIKANTLWLTLDKNDNDPKRFLRGLLAMFARRFSDMEAHFSSLMNVPLHSGIENTAEMIAYEIEQRNGRHYLVIDDLHTIENDSVLVFIQHLIDIMPENACLVLITRMDPKLKLSGLRTKNILAEVRINDLRLTREEIGKFLQDKTGLMLRDDALSIIEQRTEGWLAGIQLLSVTMGKTNPDDLEDLYNNFASSHKYVIEYLAEEILSQLPPKLVDFMHASSLFDFFSPEVCDTVFAYNNSAAMINELEDANLLIHPIDDSNRLYHYHPLLRTYLRSVAGKIDQDKYLTGAKWFEQNGFMQEALRLAVTSGNEQHYFSALSGEAEKLFETGEYRALDRWLNQLPDGFFSKHSQFHVYRAWSMLFQGYSSEAVDYATSLLNSSTIVLDEVSLARLDCLMLLAADRVENIFDADQFSALEARVKDNDLFIWIIIQLIGGNNAFLKHMYPEAEEYYKAAMETSEKISNAHLTICSVFNLSHVLIQTGKWNQAKYLCIQELKKRKIGESRHQPIAEILYLPLSRVLRKSESAAYKIDLGSRGEQACRRFSFARLIALHCPSSAEKEDEQYLRNPLSKRELDVLRLVAKGYSNIDIATTLFISLGTVKWHINNIFSKLDSKNRTQAVLKAEEYKII